MNNERNRVCPVEKAGHLESWTRKLFQNPKRMLSSFVSEGMTILDYGCGPGFFTIPLARMVGARGKVVACDLQDGMLQKVKSKIDGTELEDRVTLHLCDANSMNLTDIFDFVLAFYVVHEIPDSTLFFQDIANHLRPGGYMYISEPPGHVKSEEFEEMISVAEIAGLKVEKRPRKLIGKTVILRRQ